MRMICLNSATLTLGIFRITLSKYFSPSNTGKLGYQFFRITVSDKVRNIYRYLATILPPVTFRN